MFLVITIDDENALYYVARSGNSNRHRSLSRFPNPDACLPLGTASCAEQSEEWISGQHYLEMRDLPSNIAEQAVPMN